MSPTRPFVLHQLGDGVYVSAGGPLEVRAAAASWTPAVTGTAKLAATATAAPTAYEVLCIMMSPSGSWSSAAGQPDVGYEAAQRGLSACVPDDPLVVTAPLSPRRLVACR